ncbi:MAG: ABC transporter ATP-binding protein [Deltaproteobacteria bacterium]|nr:ABC transporter ATP-binding protein [Deltaproteobacteria bacterium]
MLNGMTKSFQDKSGHRVSVVNNFNLSLTRGECVALVGPSGCGKTTLLRMVAGLETEDSGTITLAGRDITKLPAEKRGMAVVFQHYALFPHMNVARNVAFGLEVRKLSADQIRKRVDESLALVGLADFGNRVPNELSGGQQQRVALARALVIEPTVLLCDEPLSNLDAALRKQLREEIRALQQRLSITTLYITHDIDEARAIADRIVEMG